MARDRGQRYNPRTLQRRLDALEDALEVRSPNPAEPPNRYTGKVFSGGHIGGSTGLYFLTHPVALQGAPQEGAGAGPTVTSNSAVPVAVIGSRVPAVGDYLNAIMADGGRWLAKSGGKPRRFPVFLSPEHCDPTYTWTGTGLPALTDWVAAIKDGSGNTVGIIPDNTNPTNPWGVPMLNDGTYSCVVTPGTILSQNGGINDYPRTLQLVYTTDPATGIRTIAITEPWLPRTRTYPLNFNVTNIAIYNHNPKTIRIIPPGGCISDPAGNATVSVTGGGTITSTSAGATTISVPDAATYTFTATRPARFNSSGATLNQACTMDLTGALAMSAASGYVCTSAFVLPLKSTLNLIDGAYGPAVLTYNAVTGLWEGTISATSTNCSCPGATFQIKYQYSPGVLSVSIGAGAGLTDGLRDCPGGDLSRVIPVHGNSISQTAPLAFQETFNLVDAGGHPISCNAYPDPGVGPPWTAQVTE